MKKPKTTITALSILKAPSGHPAKFCGTGTHRDQRRQPKGGRRAALRSACEGW